MNIWDAFDGVNNLQPPPVPNVISSLFNAASRGQVEKFIEVATTNNYDSIDIGKEVNGFNCFHISCKKGHIAIVEKIATIFPQVLKTQTSGNRRTGMMLAAFEGHVSIVQFLANHDTSFTLERDRDENTPLHYAAWGGHLPIVKYLIEDINCDPNVKNVEGIAPIQFAAAGNFSEIVSYLSTGNFKTSLAAESSSGGLNALHRAAIYGAIDTVKLLLATSTSTSETTTYVSLSAVTENQSTALHLAAQNGRLEVLRLLVEHGCNVDAQNEYGLTPLHYACIGGHTEIVKQLIQEYGANYTLLTASKATAMHLAAGSGRHDICQILYEKSPAEITATDCDGKTPIDAALESNYKELAAKITFWSCIEMRSQKLLCYLHRETP